MIKVIYHGYCYDGFGGAWAAWKKFGDDAKYIGWSYEAIDTPNLIMEGDEVYIIDMSFPRETILDWYDMTETLIVLDHHKTAEQDLGDLHFAHFDMNRSGAYLAWKFFHPDSPVPPIISYIEDRDLWKFDLPYSQEITDYIRSWDFDFSNYDEINSELEDDFELVVEYGVSINRFREVNVDFALRNAYWIDVGEYRVIGTNSCIFQSEIGNRLLKEYPETPFAAIFFIKENATIFSLRSEDSRVDVSEVARKLGGGGHRNASGFTVRGD